MSLMIRYVKDRRKILFGYILIVLIFITVCVLYQLDNWSQILYAAVLTGFIGICCGIYDFWKYRLHYRALCRMEVKTGEEISFADFPPPPQDLLQEEYRKRIEEAQAVFQHSLSTLRRTESERMDYYLMWAHQIKTPIAAMKLLIQNSPADGFLMERELFKIESYVEMVLHYLRLESFSSDLLLKKHDVYTMVKNAVKKYSLLFIGNKLTLHLQPFKREVVTDEKWFSFVVEQLLSNAVKYTQAGEISVYLDGAFLMIADTGIGIRAEDLPRIFERGFTGYNGRMDRKSTGIGLYLCRQVTERLGIRLDITSQPGLGTRVSLRLDV
jgi:signal transduction histidine kinase